MKNNIDLFNQISEFLAKEADMLDHKEYQNWLKLWSPSGLYIVPVDTNSNDYRNALNIAYDDEHMRQLRVERLEGGEAVSTAIALPTVRVISGVRILEASDEKVNVRCAYCLYENKGGDLRPYPGHVEFSLIPKDSSFLLEKKLVKLQKASQYLATISYIF